MRQQFAHSRSVISEIFSWKPFKIHYISCCSKNVPTSARRTFSMGKYTTNKGGSLEKIRGYPTENQSIYRSAGSTNIKQSHRLHLQPNKLYLQPHRLYLQSHKSISAFFTFYMFLHFVPFWFLHFCNFAVFANIWILDRPIHLMLKESFIYLLK